MRRSANRKLWAKVVIALIVSIFVISIAAINSDSIAGLFRPETTPPPLQTDGGTSDTGNPITQEKPPLYLASTLEDNAGVTPGKGNAVAGYPINYNDISAGKFHTLIADIDGFVYARGSNEQLQLGLGAGTTNFNVTNTTYYFNYLQPVVLLNDYTITKVAAGGFHSLVIGYDQDKGTGTSASNYKVFTWGMRDRGRLGNGSSAAGNVGVPQDISSRFSSLFASDEYPVDVSAGDHHSMLLTNKGNIFTWGCNADGQLGLGDTTDRNVPTKVTTNAARYTQISAGSVHSLALAGNGELWSWGSNTRRQLGETTAATVTAPARRFASYTFTHISAGELHSLAMNGTALYAWGDQRGGKLGDGQGGTDTQETNRHRHTLAQISTTSWRANSASAGIGSYVIASNGLLYAFGYGANTYYGTGNADTATPRTTGIGSVAHVDRGIIVLNNNEILNYGNFSHYSENWYGKSTPPMTNGYINTTPNASLNITKSSADMAVHFTPFKNIIGLPTDYNRTANTNAISSKNGVIFDVKRVKITSFHPTNNGDLAVAQVTKAVYDATTTGASGATFTSQRDKSYVVSREGYYVVRYKQNDATTYRKFQIANKSGPEVTLNTTHNNNNVFASISIYDGFGLKSLSINGQAWEPGNTTSTYSQSQNYNDGVYNTTFTITKNSTSTFNIIAIDRNDIKTEVNLDINSVVYQNAASMSKIYDGKPAVVEPVFYSKARGAFNLATFNSVYGANGYTVSPMAYKSGSVTLDAPPVDAGSYKASYSVFQGGNVILTREVDVTINKATPIFPQHHPINIKYGQSLLAAQDRQPLAVNPLDNGLGAEGVYTWQNEAIIPALDNAPSTTTDYLFDFVPTGEDANNYNAVTGITASVTANLSTSLVRIAFGSAADTNTFEYDWSTTKVVNNKAQVGLKAMPNDNSNYIFMGWQKGGSYKSVNNSFVYEMVSEMPAETDAIFTAVFAQYRLNGEIIKNVTEYYTGTPRRAEVSVDLFSQNPGLYKIGLEISSSVMPVGIGEYEVAFTVTNTELNVPVFSPVIDFSVLEAEVTAVIDPANSDGYNADTGWANSAAFRLSVNGSAAGAVQKYIYSKDSGATWQDVPGTPANQPNCPIIFIAAAASDGQSYSEAYIFKAIHSDHGAGDLSSVASSKEEVVCKIDTVTPTIDINFAGGYTSEWTNNDVTFDISATSGGSGILIFYSTDNGDNWVDTQLTDYNYGMVTEPIIHYDGLTLTRSSEQNLTYIFRVVTGTSREVILEDSFVVKIDKTAPVITKTAINQTPNENGWIKDMATVTFAITDVKDDYSGISSIEVDNGADYAINLGGSGMINKDNNNLYVSIPDYKVYIVTVTDIAGNTATYELQEKVDTKNPELAIEGYTAGEWINDTANFLFTIQAGASGVKVRYSTDGGATYTYWTTGDFLTDGEDAFQTITAEHATSEEQHKEYIFSIESGAGRVTNIPFGYVNIDKTAPVIIDDDITWSIILADYQGDSPWINEDVDMKFIVRDPHAAFNSGIDHSKVTVTNVGESVLVEHHNNGRYLFVVDKCTEYIVSVTDIAGNTTTKNYTLKVDQGEPSFTAEAYIGSTSEPYIFDEDLWLSRSNYGEDAFVRFIFNMSFTPSGARMQYSIDGKESSDPTKQWYDLTPVLFEEGNENGLEQNVTITVDVTSQQNNPYMVRIISGSERVMEGENLGRIRIDFTPPIFERPITYYSNGIQTNYNTITNVWGYEDIEAHFTSGDTPSGVSSVEVRRYEVGADHTNASVPYTVIASATQGGQFSFVMSEYAQFVVVMTDRADNVFINDPIVPRIDKTDGFAFTVDTNGYISDTWIYDESEDVRFDFPITFDPESGYTNFGPSGAMLQFSINDGMWRTDTQFGQTLQEIKDNGTLNPYMIASVSQIVTYKFRLITGAGRIFNDEGAYIVKKDTIIPVVNVSASTNGEDYNGQWTYNNVEFNLNMVVGPSRAQYYWASSSSSQITSEDEVTWNVIGSLNEAVSVDRVYSVTSTTNGMYYYFRIVAGTNRTDYTTQGRLVNIDKVAISATVTASHGGSLYRGDWVSGAVEISVANINVGPSGYVADYQTRRIGTDVYGDYLTTGYDPIRNVLTLTENTQNEYRIRLVNGAGREYYSVVVPVRIDNETPEFALVSNGTQLAAPLQNAGWWVSDLSIIYNVTRTGESGYTLQYATSQDGINWSDWMSEGIAGNTMLLTDESGYGGTRAYYKMRVISGANVASVENDYGEIKIDTNTYTISAEQLVSSTPGDYAVITNIISEYRRGDIVDSAINTTSGYFIKSLLVKSGDTVVKSETPDNLHTVVSNFTVEISGENITVELLCYKEISIVYNNRHQHLQNNVITPSYITVAEADFNDNYGELDFDVTYGGSLTVPQEIGKYTLNATVADDSFIIINPAEEDRILIVVYFSGQGSLQDEYLISNVEDLRYVDYYMSMDYEYDYLGLNRRRAVFLQTQDILLPSNFTPIGVGDSAFAGIYDGGNFKVYYDGVYTSNANFGFFDTLSAGSRVINLGVEFDLIVQGENINAGLLAAETYSADIIGSYAIGSIKASGTQLNIGGLIGFAWNSLMGANFSDVTITTLDSAGNVGGLVGEYENNSSHLNFFSNHTVSQMIIKYDSIEGREEVSAGAMAGLLSGDINYKDGENIYSNIYNMNNLTINRIPYAVQGFGNQSEWQDTGIEAKVYEVFRHNENIIGSTEHSGYQSRTVAALTARRSNAMGLQGHGTDSDPFIISSKNNLKALEIFPYAHFLQTANLVIGDFEMLNLDSAFTGIYDGSVYSIIAPSITADGSYGGFFGVLQGTVKNVKLVDIVYNFSGEEEEAYYGGIAAVMLEGATIYNTIVSGSMNISNENDREKGRIYAGGLAGVVSSANIAESISLVNINVANTYYAIVGGVIGQVEGESELNNIVSLARVTVSYNGGGMIGSSVGAVHSTSPVSGSGIYNISGNTYANGRVFESSIGSPARGDLSAISSTDYYSAVSEASGIVISGSDVLSLIESLYPFSGGAGTYDNPFIISSYTELLRVGDFMYAAFALENDIIIGDYDGDGIADPDYNYDYQPIGKGAVFTGLLDGRDYSISGLTDALFEINAGQVRNLRLNIHYAAYGANNPRLAADPRAKALSGNEDVVFGAVAKYNRAGGDIRMVIVSGEINIQNPGRGRVKAGGIIGIATGGMIRNSISHANINISSVSADIGGVVGSVDGNIKIEDSIMLTYNVILEKINAYGSVINAGLIAGAVRSNKAEIDLNNQATSAKVYINGKEALEGKELVGLNPFAD